MKKLVADLSLYRDAIDGTFKHLDIERLEACTQAMTAAAEKPLLLADTFVPPTVQSIEQALMDIETDRPLSKREAGVCARVVMGYTNNATSLSLGLSHHSVATYRRRAYSKLQITSQSELFALLLSRSRLQLTHKPHIENLRQTTHRRYATRPLNRPQGDRS